ncbi:hypothetical protein [Allorhizobium taibaishanense]|uniref:Aspartokinase-like uncharacterized kinase n=1 Tax=Allorhizobium taibaishanense TaxID=887144 RepID=A0A1Q9A2Y0_9HYPH|nr:hypothetical protein [Allorhizobium taibaishanense]MBB4005840.1 aspartokinase-like uncharacterized kinase [Allorhizobium taibaishanense]OLP48886.1 hypothetical protein BJF91_17280 [Allorhizobium taibaishanense]
MIPLASNPAVTEPKTTLTQAQQSALLAIRFYRFNSRARGRWRVGNDTVATATIKALIGHGLVIERGGQNPLTLTRAGELAADKLKG